MEVEFTYIVHVTDDQHAALSEAADRAVALKTQIARYTLSTVADGKAVFNVTSAPGHDRTAITRRFAAPIRALFTRAKIPAKHIQLISSLLVPTARSLTLEQGRTPSGTFTDPALRQMLADYGAARQREEPATGEQ